MIRKIKTNEGIEYKKLSPEEMKKRRILGQLVGPCADFINPTRNGRKYSEELWENVFNDPIMQERIQNGVCFGELGHPADRTETDPEKIAICLRQQPVKDDSGKLIAVFDILDTPNGRILQTLCEYGSTVGVSSRGQGDLVQDFEGNESVDCDTYDCQGWDVVLIPAVKTARVKYIKEGLEAISNNKNLKKALCESLEKASQKDKEIMEETLNSLNINLAEGVEEEENLPPPEEEEEEKEEEEVEKDSEEPKEEEPVENSTELVDVVNAWAEQWNETHLDTLPEMSEEDVQALAQVIIKALKNTDIEEQNEEEEDLGSAESIPDDEQIGSDEGSAEINSEGVTKEGTKEVAAEAADNGEGAILDSLKEVLKVKVALEEQIKDLQKQLAVSDTKVDESIGECERYKGATARLAAIAKNNKNLNEKISSLNESLKEKETLVENQRQKITRLVKARKVASEDTASLVEQLNESLGENKKLKQHIEVLNEQLSAKKKEVETKAVEINESLKKVQKTENLQESLNKEKTLKESYKKLATKAVNKYIEAQATMLGLPSSDIKRKLGETYTIEDVDIICEDLKSYQLNISKLPFSVDNKLSVRINEGGSDKNLVGNKPRFEDDDVDIHLIKLAGM